MKLLIACCLYAVLFVIVFGYTLPSVMGLCS